MKNLILYHQDIMEQRYFIWFDSSLKGMLMGDKELCEFVGISLEKYDELIKKYVKEIIFPYSNSHYRVTYFLYEKDVKELIEILESFLVFKALNK